MKVIRDQAGAREFVREMGGSPPAAEAAPTVEGVPWRVLIGDVRDGLRSLPDGCVQTCITSPPYYALRDYGAAGQIGLEPTMDEYLSAMVEVFREVRRVLRDDGTVWVNMGDTYCSSPPGCQNGGVSESSTLHGVNGISATYRETLRQSVGQKRDTSKERGLKPKDLMGVPWRLAFALQADGWFLRSAITLCKLSPMPESVADRPSSATEMLFLLSKSGRYFYDRHAERRIMAEQSMLRLTQNLEAQAGSERANGQAKTNGTMKAVGDPEDGANLWNYWPFRSGNFDEAHFATFHEDLPERCIRLGTSEKGCCPACGAPWRRVTAKDRKPTRPGTGSKVHGTKSVTHRVHHDPLEVGNRDPQRHCTETRTVGWAPSCGCGAGEPVPCLVLDPFLGSGTTAAVAVKLGRHAVGTELNPKYAAMAERRIKAALCPSTARDMTKTDDSPLFTEVPQ